MLRANKLFILNLDNKINSRANNAFATSPCARLAAKNILWPLGVHSSVSQSKCC